MHASGRYFLFYAQTIYSIAFWFIVCIILLNVIFGIIIDSFGELRLHREMIKGKIDNECFICGIDRFTLDTQGGGFEHHRKVEHEKWNYLFMLVTPRADPPPRRPHSLPSPTRAHTPPSRLACG